MANGLRIFLCVLLALASAAHAEIFVEFKHRDFHQQVKSALQLLKERVPDELKIVERYIGHIKEVEYWLQSGMVPTTEPPTFRMSRGTALKSLTWAAGAIVHDACHSRLFHEYRNKHKVEYPPEAAWSGPKVELQCIAYQLKVMRRLGAPADEITALEKADGMHAQRAQWGYMK